MAHPHYPWGPLRIAMVKVMFAIRVRVRVRVIYLEFLNTKSVPIINFPVSVIPVVPFATVGIIVIYKLRGFTSFVPGLYLIAFSIETFAIISWAV